MSISRVHPFHIPVMGLSFTVDTPVKVARFGISSVVSVIEDELVEKMRKYYCESLQLPYKHITKTEHDYRAKRITEYLNLLDLIVKNQLAILKNERFEEGAEIVKYFELLPENAPLKQVYLKMKLSSGYVKQKLQEELRAGIVSGDIDVNIMTKVDKTNYTPTGEPLSVEFNDALAALRGFAQSNVSSSVVFSAGLNPRLYSYCETFNDFFPDKNGAVKKRITIKVSDYRSALIQGKFLAKKGLWVSEFRIESGLNCGGHAFATDGLLLGPVMEEFKAKREELTNTLFELCNQTLKEKGRDAFPYVPKLSITVQGGVGTFNEQQFFLSYYKMDSIGWGSPFLLVPEVTNVDYATLSELATAKPDDYYLSDASPLGVPFNNFKKSSSEVQRKARIEKHRAGSPCYLKFLSFNTEFTEKPICVASREYQNLKIKQLKTSGADEKTVQREIDLVTEKDCLCEGLSTSVFIEKHIPHPHKLAAVTICPGPNLAYFSGVFTLVQMAGHIYGRGNLLNSVPRSHVFVNELRLYVDYLKREISKNILALSSKKEEYFNTFRSNLLSGINYYISLLDKMQLEKESLINQMKTEFAELEQQLAGMITA
jgi:hypothetical protein